MHYAEHSNKAMANHPRNSHWSRKNQKYYATKLSEVKINKVQLIEYIQNLCVLAHHLDQMKDPSINSREHLVAGWWKTSPESPLHAIYS